MCGKILSILATIFAAISGVSAAISARLMYVTYCKNREMNIKPVVVFTKDKPTADDREGWYLNNVGNGPAMNPLLASRSQDGEWTEYRQCPTLARGMTFPIKLALQR